MPVALENTQCPLLRERPVPAGHRLASSGPRDTASPSPCKHWVLLRKHTMPTGHSIQCPLDTSTPAGHSLTRPMPAGHPLTSPGARDTASPCTAHCSEERHPLPVVLKTPNAHWTLFLCPLDTLPRHLGCMTLHPHSPCTAYWSRKHTMPTASTLYPHWTLFPVICPRHLGCMISPYTGYCF
jgi:hypothetical protein